MSTSQSLGLGPSLLSSEEILQQAISLTMSDGFLTEDEILAAFLFFTSSSEDVVHITRTFITLGSNQAVQCRFLINQLNAAPLLLEKAKDKDKDDSMLY